MGIPHGVSHYEIDATAQLMFELAFQLKVVRQPGSERSIGQKLDDEIDVTGVGKVGALDRRSKNVESLNPELTAEFADRVPFIFK